MQSPHLSRRTFLRSALTVGALGPLSSFADELTVASGAEFAEPERKIKLVEDCDVIVCGAGPAGVTAAITAARAGARVRLFEWRGCLGGVWTAGLLGYFLDFDKPGFTKELRLLLEARGARGGSNRSTNFSYDPEALKILLEELCLKAGVNIQLHTRVARAYLEGRRLKTIVTESKSGAESWRAPVFIDTTGDGDLGALAGCSFEFGETVDCPCQPMSLNALLMVKDVEALREYVRFGAPRPGENSEVEKKRLLRELFKTHGVKTSYVSPTLHHVRGNLLFAMMNEEYGVKPWDAAAVTAATLRARAEMNLLIDTLRGLGGPWEGIQIVATAEQIGVRDGRRIAGRFTVRKSDVIAGSRYEDAVVRATFSVDVHSAGPNQRQAAIGPKIKVAPYDIPLRALIAKEVDGLMMAGRCISGDFVAHASYRVTGNAVGMGEGAGVIAAIAAKTNRMPHDVPWSEGLAKLKEMGQRK